MSSSLHRSAALGGTSRHCCEAIAVQHSQQKQAYCRLACMPALSAAAGTVRARKSLGPQAVLNVDTLETVPTRMPCSQCGLWNTPQRTRRFGSSWKLVYRGDSTQLSTLAAGTSCMEGSPDCASFQSPTAAPRRSGPEQGRRDRPGQVTMTSAITTLP